MNYHGRMINISEARAPLSTEPQKLTWFKQGHRCARHAAAEIANEADREIAELNVALSRWRAVAIDLAECHAANAECPPKSLSKYNRKRYRGILEKAVKFLKGGSPEHWQLGSIEDTIKRCEKAAREIEI